MTPELATALATAVTALVPYIKWAIFCRCFTWFFYYKVN